MTSDLCWCEHVKVALVVWECVGVDVLSVCVCVCLCGLTR